MTGKRAPAVLAAMLLAWPVTLAQSTATLEATAFEATGTIEGSGTLAAMTRVFGDLPGPEFTLQAKHLMVETDVADPVIMGGATTYTHDPQTTTSNHTQAQIEGTAIREGFRWLILPASRGETKIHAAVGCMEGGGEQEPLDAWDSQAKQARGSLEPELSNTFTASPCTQNGHLVVQGDFTIVLWQWDAILRERGHQQEVWSGMRPSSQDPLGTPESGAVVQEHREVFLHASAATLNVALYPQDVFFLTDASLTIGGNAKLTGASGVIRSESGDLDVQDASVYVGGDLELGMTDQGGGLTVSLGGDVEELRVNGQAVAPSDEPMSNDPATWVWTTATVAVLVSLALAAGLHRWYPRHVYNQAARRGVRVWSSDPTTPPERRAMGWHILGRRALEGDNKRIGRALRMARLAERTAPRVADHQRLRIRVLKAAGRHEETIPVHHMLKVLLPPGSGRARNAEEAALACAKLGRDDEAAAWLVRLYQDSPRRYSDVVARPEFRDVAQHGLRAHGARLKQAASSASRQGAF